MSRDERLALRSLLAAVESNTESIKNLTAHIKQRLDAIDAHISTLIDTVADHIAHHGDAS
ncbi:MAG TPA: hypothetical protein VIQ02_09105 [Jiangellaceae bacterium]